ncbi:MAG: hypothetical protein Q4A70_03970 [Candidatus Saccharibacteria bacterium]|nr:hypothetical protein [Candidatus Saccharibacteria bacterium]
MAENVRSIKAILEELLKGKDSALAKLARVRETQYEIGLWNGHGALLSDIAVTAKKYFSKRFLDGKLLKEVKKDELEEGLKKLAYAVESCKKRCTRLVEELNQAMSEQGLEPLKDIQGFLDWMTFFYEEKKDYTGQPVYDLEGHFPIRIFSSDKNRREFWVETQAIMRSGRIMSVKDIAQIVFFKRKHSVKI